MKVAKERLTILQGYNMGKFIIVSFLALGLAFYELSGGADFVPEDRVAVAHAPITDDSRLGQTTDVAVSRSNAASLIALNPSVTTVSLDATPAATPAVAVVEEIIEVPVTAIETAPLDIRIVASTRVNMRQGPGTSFDVLDTLDGGTQAEVLEVNESGWARVEVLTTGQVGWMAERLLTDG
jgi:hypothetical protein